MSGAAAVEADGSSTWGDTDAVGPVHERWLGTARPAATMVVVAGLLRPEWRVKIEAEAIVGEI